MTKAASTKAPRKTKAVNVVEPDVVNPIASAYVDPNPAPVPPTIDEAQPDLDQSDPSAHAAQSLPQKGAPVANQTATGKGVKAEPEPGYGGAVVEAMAAIIRETAEDVPEEVIEVDKTRVPEPTVEQLHGILGPGATTAASRIT